MVNIHSQVTVSSADEKVIISEDKATVTVKVTIDKTAPTIESVKVNDATAIYDKGVITLEQGSAVDTIEITMSEAVVLPAGLNVLFDTVDFDSNSGAPTDFEGRVYGTATLKDGDNKTIIIKPSENNGVAAYVGTITFKLSGTVTDLAGNAFAGAIPTLNVTSSNLVQNAQDAQKAVAKGGVTLFVSDIAVEEEELVTGYGSNKTGIAQTNLGVINGNGKTLSVVGANRTWDSAIYTKGGTIENLTIDSGFRGILIEATKGDVVIDSVTIDRPVYTINSDNGGNNKLIVSNSTLKGWTSYARTHSQASFTNCKFGEGSGYAFLRPYAPSTFVNCEFETGFKLDATKTSDIVLENCTVNGVALTAENLTTLLGDSAANAIVK